LILVLLFIISGAQFFNTRVRADVLKYLSASEYFVSARILTTTVLSIFGIFVFRELLSGSQLFGLIIGTCGILLLFEEDTKLQHSRNWLRALSLLMISVLLGSILQIAAKYAAIESDKTIVMLFYEGIFL
jgi:drug/metabolite transporter (DMT)-like permease